MEMLYKVVLFFAFLVSLMAASHAAPKEESEIIVALHNYYSAEASRNWESVYKMRTSRFRQGVMLKDFVAPMEHYSRGWQLRGWKIEKVHIEGKIATVSLTFYEVPPKGFAGIDKLKGPGNVIVIEAKALWAYENGEWRCQRAPSRAHLPFTE